LPFDVTEKLQSSAGLKGKSVAGVSLPGIDAANYPVQVSTMDITPKEITAITGISAANKIYDGNTNATLATGAAGLHRDGGRG
jgi:hypothetical protein